MQVYKNKWVIIGLKKPECESLWYTKRNEKCAVPKYKCAPIRLGTAQAKEEKRNCFLHRMKDHCWMAPGIKWQSTKFAP
jgi:hypothetical protein